MKNISGFIIEEDKEILHPTESKGVGIIRTQLLREERTGKRFTVRMWGRLETGRITHITNDVLEVARALAPKPGADER